MPQLRDSEIAGLSTPPPPSLCGHRGQRFPNCSHRLPNSKPSASASPPPARPPASYFSLPWFDECFSRTITLSMSHPA